MLKRRCLVNTRRLRLSIFSIFLSIYTLFCVKFLEIQNSAKSAGSTGVAPPQKSGFGSEVDGSANFG